MRKIERLAQKGLSHVKRFVEKKNNEWKDIPLHIGVTGLSGVGKSYLINVIRGVKVGQKGYAKVGAVGDTTTEIAPYPHPENPNLIFWDMPGAGTPSFSRKSYFEKVQFIKFDFFLILFQRRFHEDIAWLARKVQSLGKKCFFIRTDVHRDVVSELKEDPKNTKNAVLEGIRKRFMEDLAKEKMNTNEVFLIDNEMPQKYDFDALTARLIQEIPDQTKREAFVLALSSVSESVINEKKKAFQKRIWRVAVASAIGGAVPLPLVGAAIDTVLIIGEANEYRKQFGLTEEALKGKFPESSKSFIELRNHFMTLSTDVVFSITADEALEGSIKIGIPVIGCLVSGAISYGVAVATLTKILNALAEDAHEVNRIIFQTLTDTSL